MIVIQKVRESPLKNLTWSWFNNFEMPTFCELIDIIRESQGYWNAPAVLIM